MSSWRPSSPHHDDQSAPGWPLCPVCQADEVHLMVGFPTSWCRACHTTFSHAQEVTQQVVRWFQENQEL